jgi:hypothetical protein
MFALPLEATTSKPPRVPGTGGFSFLVRRLQQTANNASAEVPGKGQRPVRWGRWCTVQRRPLAGAGALPGLGPFAMGGTSTELRSVPVRVFLVTA